MFTGPRPTVEHADRRHEYARGSRLASRPQRGSHHFSSPAEEKTPTASAEEETTSRDSEDWRLLDSLRLRGRALRARGRAAVVAAVVPAVVGPVVSAVGNGPVEEGVGRGTHVKIKSLGEVNM